MTKKKKIETAPTTEDILAKYAGLATKSAKIRAMAADGMKRGEIAKLLNIRYQHVRNVLTNPLKKAG